MGIVIALLFSLTRAPSENIREVLPVTFSVDAPTGVRPGTLQISPDGRVVAFRGGRDVGEFEVYLRRLGQLGTEILAGTERTIPYAFSADGQEMLVSDRRTLKRVPLGGGLTTTVSEDSGLGADWGTDGVIVQGSEQGLWLSQAPDEARVSLTTVQEGELAHVAPRFLPGGRAVVYHIWTGNPDTTVIAIWDLATGEQRRLLPGTSPRYVPGEHLVFWREGSLWGVPFDISSLEISGPPVRLVDGVSVDAVGHFTAEYAVSPDGTLVYVPLPPTPVENRSLVWVDREGNEEPMTTETAAYEGPQLSPDGQQLAVAIAEGSGNWDIWIHELARGISTRFTFDPAVDAIPVWTPSGERILFASGRGGDSPLNIYGKAADGTGPVERLTTSPNIQVAWHVAPDESVVFAEITPGTGQDVGVFTPDAEDQPRMLLQSEFLESHPRVSPDGRWLAYSSDETGRREIYVRPFPNVDDGRWQISNGYGLGPIWSPDGSELFYQAPTDPDSSGRTTLFAVPIETDPTFRPGNPVALFDGPYRLGIATQLHAFDVAADGRFLMVKEAADTASATDPNQIVAIQHWTEELKRLRR